MEIHFAGQYTRKDFVRAYNAHYMFTPGWKVFTISLWVVLGVMASVCLLTLFRTDSLAMWIGIWLPFIVILPLTIAYRYLEPIFAANRMIKGAEFQGPISGTAGESGFSLQSQVSTGQVQWAAYKKALYQSDFVMVYTKSPMFQLFPRRFFLSDGDWQAFQDLVKANVH